MAHCVISIISDADEGLVPGCVVHAVYAHTTVTASRPARYLDPLAERLQGTLSRLRQVPQDLGEVYELVIQFIRKGGRLPMYARRIEGAGQRARRRLPCSARGP